MKNLNLITIKEGYQLATIEGVEYVFNFTESELADSIEANNLNSELSYRSGLHQDDYTPTEMAREIASYWEAEDVEVLIKDMPVGELVDYRKELEHAA